MILARIVGEAFGKKKVKNSTVKSMNSKQMRMPCVMGIKSRCKE
jgi:hypothetical protein